MVRWLWIGECTIILPAVWRLKRKLPRCWSHLRVQDSLGTSVQVSNVVYRQTNKMEHFDLECFDFGTFWLLTLWLGTFWLWDVLTLGCFDLGRFDSGTFWLGTFWLWDVLTWDVLTLRHFDQCVHKKSLLSPVWLNKMKIYLGRFDSQKMGRFGFGTFWLDTSSLHWSM